jgi:hypothetical protein
LENDGKEAAHQAPTHIFWIADQESGCLARLQRQAETIAVEDAD